MSLQGILNTLHRRLSTTHDDDSRDLLALEELNRPDGVLSACKAVLQDVIRIIEGLQKKKLSSVIAAVTSGQKFLEAKSRIERLKGLLMLALSSDHMYALNCSLPHLYISFVEQIRCLAAVFLPNNAQILAFAGLLIIAANNCSDLARYPMPSKSIFTLPSVDCNTGKKKSTLSF